MTIGQKLVLGFVGIALLVGIVGGFAIFQTKMSQNIVEKEVYRSMTDLHDAWTLMEAQEHQEIAVNNYLFLDTGLEERRADYFYEKERLEKVYQKYYKKSCVCVKPLLEKYHENMKIYNTKIEEVFEFYKQGTDLETLKEKVREANKFVETAHEDSLEPIIEHLQKDHIEPAKKDIAKAINRTISTIVISSIIAVFLAIILGVFISRSISVPITKLKYAAVEIGKGKLEIRTEIKSKDEVGVLAASFDKMAQNLKETLVSRDYTDNIVNSMADILIVITPDGKIEKANRAALDVLGYNEEELIGKDVSLLFPEEEMPLKETKLEKLIIEGILKDYETNYRVKDGRKIPVLLSGAAMKDKNGNIKSAVCVAKDITERKKAEEKQRVLMEDLEAINKELDDFTYIVSHDLKEPLRSIDAFSKFIEEDYKDKFDEESRNYFVRIRANAGRMQNLIEDLLEISRIERRKNFLEGVQPEELIDEVRFRLEYAIKQKNAMIILRDRLPRIFCDRVRLTEVFLNLISNAVKFNDKPEPRIEIGSNQRGIFYEFYVKDNGPGIERRYFDKIFEIFQRLGKKEENEGTGAGLTIVKKIVQMHSGKIWVESKIGKGTTFYFTIPKKKGAIKKKRRIGEILIEKKMLTEVELKEGLEEQKEEA